MIERNKSYKVIPQDEQKKGKTTKWLELELYGNIRNLSPSVWTLTSLTSLYVNSNALTHVPGQISLLQNLMRLDLSNNKLRSIPAELGDLTELRELDLAYNQIRSLPYELGKLFQLLKLSLKNNPLAPEIMGLYQESNGTRKLLEFMLDNLPVSDTIPPPRPWMSMSELDHSRPAVTFTVMCYNVLCDRYATRQMYGYCPQWALNWEYRKKGILDEVRHYSADIVTLQEVETEQFYHFFLPELKRDGYEGIFSPKSRAKTMSESERVHVDGCAIFWRTSKFSLVKEHLVEFNQVAMANAEGSDVMLNRVMTKDNIALAALLETKENAWTNGQPQEPMPLLVATAHVHWDPEYCDVKLIQTMMLVDQLKKICEEQTHVFRPGAPNHNKFDPGAIQMLLCGDFNSLPDSGVIEYLQNSRISINHKDFKSHQYKETLQKMLSHSDNDQNYTHAFKLSSVYSPEFMPYTNYTYDFKGMIDYIFYPTKTMRPTGLLGPVDKQWFKDNKVIGCPHPHITSDHFSLLVELCMQPEPGRQSNR